ncbi:MAG TPA: thioesterase family protein [Pseudonocardiaceae bacterium]|nr:thioesterase family protein [Pseudonocardiaceae bacterium]
MTIVGTTTFTAVSAVTPRPPSDAVAGSAFDAGIDERWTIAGRPNGGYLLALVGRAATEAGGHRHVLAASAHYLRSPDPGPAVVEIVPLRTGRGTSQVRGRLVQGDAVCVEALLTLGTVRGEDTVFWQNGLPDPDLTDPDAGVRIPATTPGGMPAAVMDEVSLSLDPASFRAFAEGPSGRGELWGWLALPKDEPFGPVALLYAVDSFPPATFDVAQESGWVPTLELTAYVRALPAPGPVRILHKARLIDDRRVDEACFVWDVKGRLVAQSTQLAAIRLP